MTALSQEHHASLEEKQREHEAGQAEAAARESELQAQLLQVLPQTRSDEPGRPRRER